MSLSDFFEQLGRELSKDCDCTECREKRGEAEWVFVKSLTPSEIEESQSIKAHGNNLKKRLKQLNSEVMEAAMRRKLFWSRIERELDAIDSPLRLSDDQTTVERLFTKRKS